MSNIYDKSSLVLIPSGTKTGKVFSQKPVSGDGDFTFTRASAATRVNADGNIEKETQNKLLYSNTFSNAAWVKSGATFSGDTLTASAGTSFKGVYQLDTTQGVQVNYFDVAYVNHQWVQILVGSGGSDLGYVNFDIQNKAIGTASGVIDASIQDFGTYLRLVYVATTANKTAANIAFVDSGSSSRGATSSSTGAFKLFRSQVEQGLVARDYIETTTAAVYGGITDNTPRLDYTDSSCPALLLEPQRTNDVRNSEYFDASIWSYYFFNSGSLTRTFGYESPAGTNDAYKFDVALGTGGALLTQNITAVASVDYTLSVWMKGEVGGEKVQIDFKSGASQGPSGTNFTLTTEWVRYEVSVTNDTGTSRGFQFRFTTSNVPSDQTLYVWGAQCEQGSYATSYIPTYGSSVSRVAETCNKDNIPSLLNDDEGTLFVNMSALANAGGSRVLTIGDGTGANRVQLFFYGTNELRANVISSSVSQVSGFTYTGDQTANIKALLKYKANDVQFYVNGTLVASDTSVTMPSGLDVFRLNNGTGSAPMYADIKNLIYIPTSITDQEAIDLTTI